MSKHWLPVFRNKRVKTDDVDIVEKEKVDVKAAILVPNVKTVAKNNVCLTIDDYHNGVIILHCQECGCQRKFKPLKINRKRQLVTPIIEYERNMCGNQILF